MLKKKFVAVSAISLLSATGTIWPIFLSLSARARAGGHPAGPKLPGAQAAKSAVSSACQSLRSVYSFESTALPRSATML
jgi:hypothetical protein